MNIMPGSRHSSDAHSGQLSSITSSPTRWARLHTTAAVTNWTRNERTSALLTNTTTCKVLTQRLMEYQGRFKSPYPDSHVQQLGLETRYLWSMVATECVLYSSPRHIPRDPRRKELDMRRNAFRSERITALCFQMPRGMIVPSIPLSGCSFS